VAADGGAGGCVGVARAAWRDGGVQMFGAHAGGGGAGGSVWVTAGSVGGRGGISARGGASGARCHLAWPGGGGGGGRVAIEVTNASRADIGVNASGGRSGEWGAPEGADAPRADGSVAARAAGCAAGAAGTVLVRAGGQIVMVVDNGGAGGAGGRAASTPLPEEPLALDALLVRGGARVGFPAANFTAGGGELRWVHVSGGAALSPAAAPPGGAAARAALRAGRIDVGAEGTLGCLPCSAALEVRNGAAGCASSCPPLALAVRALALARGSQLLALDLALSANETVHARRTRPAPPRRAARRRDALGAERQLWRCRALCE
jgi:hypothetical protein